MLRVPFELSVVAVCLGVLLAGYLLMTWGESVSKNIPMLLMGLEVNHIVMSTATKGMRGQVKCI